MPGWNWSRRPQNLVDACWHDRPAPRVSPALLLAEQYTGESSSAKRERIGAQIAAKGAEAALVFAPDSISWLFNIRGTDIPKLPVVQGLALLEADGQATLLVDPGRVPEGFAAHVGEGVTVLPETDAAAGAGRLPGPAQCWQTRIRPMPGASWPWSRAVQPWWRAVTRCYCPRPAKTPWKYRAAVMPIFAMR